MKNGKADRRLAGWLRFSGALYALGGTGFLARPHDAVEALGRVGEPLDEEPAGLYSSLSTAYMATITALAFAAASSDDEGRAKLIPPLLVAKATSSSALLVQFFRTRRAGFAAGAALDALLLGVTAGLHAATRENR
jgi:hypothetical protein